MDSGSDARNSVDTLMQRLAHRSGLSKKFGITFVEGNWPRLEIEHPAGVARFIGEAKKLLWPNRVFLRGQVEHHNSMLPSLFRANVHDSDLIIEAEIEFADRVRRKIPVKRFGCEDLPALLQHYGFRTSWLDAVDNLFVAVWFARSELRTGADLLLQISQSSRTHGWIFLIATKAGTEELRQVDLRVKHHPLSARPHIQHGISLRKDPSLDPDFRKFVVGTVRFPIKNYSTGGTLFDSSFLIPPPEIDHTLKLLLKHKVNDIASLVENQYKLPEGALGRVSQPRRAVTR